MRFGCCAGPEKADVLLKAGCDFYEPTVINHLVPEKSEEEFMFLKEQFIKSKLKPEAFNCFLPGDLKVVGDTVDEKRFAEYISRAFMRAGEAGAKIIVFGSGGSRMVPDNYLTEKAVSQMKRALEIIVPAAKQNKLAVCIEGLNKKATNFLNRIDDTIMFRSLTKEDIYRIIDIQMVLIQKRLAERKLTIGLTEKAKNYIADNGFSPIYGARPLKRALQKLILDNLALKILEGAFAEGDNIVVDMQKGNIEIN